MLRAVVIAFVLVLLNAAPLSSKTASVSIEALYRERMLLPERATLRVRLTDAESGNVIASTTLDNPHVPVHLELSYEPSNIDNAHVYTVTAQIAVNGEPFFATSSPAKVITRGNPSQVELLLERVTAESATMLEDGQWALLELHGRAVIAEHRPFLAMSAGHASGSGGCNRFSGGYKLSGNAIEFTATATTMMACIHEHVTETETAFFKTLADVRYWKVAERQLQLLGKEHNTLMRFEKCD